MDLKRSLVAMMVMIVATVALCFKAIDQGTWERLILAAFGAYYTLKTVTDYLPGNGKVTPK